MKNKLSLEKKPTSMKLASMSKHYQGSPWTKSGKHRSQELQAIMKQDRRNERRRKAKELN